MSKHHYKKFCWLSGTTGLTDCADGTLVLVRDKRGESKATLSVTGRDIEDQEIALDFLNCRWPVSENPLRDEPTMNAILEFLEQEKAFEGSATELSYRLEKVMGLPSAFELQWLMQCFQKEPLVYRVFYFMAIATGLRRGELCALRWNSFHTNWMLEITASRSSVPGQGILEGKTKNGKKRYATLPGGVF